MNNGDPRRNDPQAKSGQALKGGETDESKGWRLAEDANEHPAKDAGIGIWISKSIAGVGKTEKARRGVGRL